MALRCLAVGPGRDRPSAQRSWNQILDQWLLNRDEALAEQTQERISAEYRDNRTKLREAETKIKRLESALSDEKRLHENLKKRHRRAQQKYLRDQTRTRETQSRRGPRKSNPCTAVKTTTPTSANSTGKKARQQTDITASKKINGRQRQHRRHPKQQ